MHEQSLRPGERVQIVDDETQRAAQGTEGVIVGTTPATTDEGPQVIVAVNNESPTNAVVPTRAVEPLNRDDA